MINLFVYLLQHSYLIDDESDTYETKIIGIYSTEQKAMDVVESYKNKEGFKNYPQDFYIDKYKIDENFWSEGFIKFD